MIARRSSPREARGLPDHRPGSYVNAAAALGVRRRAAEGRTSPGTPSRRLGFHDRSRLVERLAGCFD